MLKVLIADDEAIERKYLSSLFQKRPDQYCIVGEARNGRQIVELARQTKPDIIIMDIHMPLMNGLESAHEIRQEFPQTLILLNTAYAEFEFARKAIDYNLDAYLLKPASEEQIFGAIENCLDKRQLPSSPPGCTGGPQDAVSTVTAYIDSHFRQSLSLQELADLVHFSPSYLSRIFHQETGLTIKAYVNERRLCYAMNLLRNTELSIQEIAAECGFSTPSHFNRVFKQHTGGSPLEFRHLHR